MARQNPETSFFPGLSWCALSAQAPQAQIQRRLLADLQASRRIGASGANRQRMAALVRSMQATGRVPIEMPDSQWLAVHPAKDPVLEAGQQVLVPHARPTVVAVITDSAGLCTVAHQGGRQARAFLQACLGEAALGIDTAWVVQPDGRVATYGIATWNAHSQDEVGPGSWIWAPARDAGWPVSFSSDLARLLAAQGPALGGAGAEPDALMPQLAWSGRQAAASDLPVLARARDAAISANDWGLIGLLQTPTARMAEAGDVHAGFSHVYPYGRINVLLQPFDWLETGFRYTSIYNRLYGPAALSGTQSYKDKSADVKLRVWRESAAAPEVAVGITDVGGTGLFGGEYLVANKRWGDLDASAGLGWGYQGARADLTNPLSIFGQSFETRARPASANGGTFNLHSYFHGRAALFGGLQYRLPGENWLLKAEYDGNDYRSEPTQIPHGQRTPVNVGVVYRAAPTVDLSAGIERGNIIMLAFNFHSALNRLDAPKVFDPGPPLVAAAPAVAAAISPATISAASSAVSPAVAAPVSPAGAPATAPVAAPVAKPDWVQTAVDLQRQTQWTVSQIRRQGRDLQVIVQGPYGAYVAQRIERAVAVLHRDAPADIERFVISLSEYGMPVTDWVVLRRPWVDEHTRYLAVPRPRQIEAQTAPRGPLDGEVLLEPRRDRVTVGLEPSYSQVVGGPNGFVLFALGVAAPASVRLSESTWASGEANVRLLDNYKNFTYDGPSLLPRVRTYLREYLTTSRATLPNLQVTHVGTLGGEQFYSLYAGLLESMFAGAGAEWLYRPWNSPVALGVDVNRVQQRAFEQNFAMRDYRVTTGHATLYWDTGWKDTHVDLSIGRYLAGDRGATLDVSRRFANGVDIGAYATRTNVSAAQFGEGSFDKGIYVRMPFDALLMASSTASARFLWSPLTRDGGAKLNRAVTLEDLTSARDNRASWLHAAGYRRRATPDDETDGDRTPDPWSEFGASAGELGRVAGSPAGLAAALEGAAWVAAAALLDKPMANWASRYESGHPGGRWDKVGKAAADIPLALGAAAGLLWLDVGGALAARTAQTALLAGVFTVGTGEALRFAVNRARPDQGLGAGHLGSPGRNAAQSGFPSLSAGAAFALATPFAQQYDAPWLYAFAGLAGLGRVEQRRNFVSDVAAGSLIGYGVATVLLDGQRNGGRGPVIALTGKSSLSAVWRF